MVAGAGLAVISALLPPAAEGSESAVIACGAIALCAGIALLFAASTEMSIPEPVLGIAALLGTTLIAVATYAGGFEQVGTQDNEMLFLWVVLFAFYYFATWHALLQLAAIGVAYGLILSETATAEEAPTRFIIVIGTLLVAGLLIARLRVGIEELIDSLTRQAQRDDLTGVGNRRLLDERAHAAFSAGATGGTPVGFLVVDLDRFAMFNELQGQQDGDDVLRHVARTLEQSVRREDLVARLGGDEFGILMPGASAEEVERIAHRVIENLRRSWNGPALTTVSVGGVSGPARGRSLADLWRSAERALEVARSTGGDQARLARDPV
jgi:diguanylate cyclase (GGDEF)-like protein